MKMTAFYQTTRLLPDGKKIYGGEDALPYADSKTVLVADGLGGRGGYPHTGITEQITNKETFYDLVFAPLFEKMPDEQFINYIYESFSEVFETASYYFTDSHTMRSSAYFASRLISIITLYNVKFNEEFNQDRLFENVYAAEEENRQQVIKDYCAKLGAVIKEKLTLAAENLNLKLEAIVSGAYLLPSTLAVALVNEKEEEVDVIYLWSGDSRGYLWTEEGLKQITEDHERYGTMTNLVTLSKDFVIEGALVSGVKKPCFILNTSDGAYGCPVFASAFDLEYLVLDAIKKNADFDKAAKALQEVYKTICTRDDSATIALYAYGFADYQEVIKAVNNRIEYFNSNVIARLPGILEIDYGYEVQKAVNELIEALSLSEKPLLNKEYKSELILKMINGNYKPYFENLQKEIEKSALKEYFERNGKSLKDIALEYLNKNLDEISAVCSKCKEDMLIIVRENWNKKARLCMFYEKSNVQLTQDGENYNEKNNGELEKMIAVFLHIKNGTISLSGKTLTFKDLSRELFEEDAVKLKNCLEFLNVASLLRNFVKFLNKDFNDFYVKQYYFENGKSFATKLFEKMDLNVCDFGDEKVNNVAKKVVEARNNYALREEIYAEYEKEHKKLYRRSELL